MSEELNTTQKALMQAMVDSGESKENAKKRVLGYKGKQKQNVNDNLKCPRCSSTMQVAKLSTGRRVKYCTGDRVCLPFKEKE